MRKIYIITAFIVDANGAFHLLDGYPKTFDSKNYNDDTQKAYNRALGDFHDVVGGMCKNDTRKVQTIVLADETGGTLQEFTMGELNPTEE